MSQRRAKQKLGYIVVGDLGGMLLSRTTGVLAFAREITVFPDRRAAQRAIRATTAYARQRGLNWAEWANYRVQLVRSA